MHALLQTLDPVTAERLHPTDSQRIQRALEVCLASGKPMSALLAASEQEKPPYNFLQLALLPSDRTVLHERIAQRFDAMLRTGLLDEVRQLRSTYQLSLELPSMRCVGYRQAWEALDGSLPLDELRDRGIYATRQLAKRQITWLGNSFTAETFDCLNPALAHSILERTQKFLA